MAKFVFHVGMGKTGTTTIQAALANSASALADKGYLYLGQWLGYIRPEFDGFRGFQDFLKQSPREYEFISNHFVNSIEDKNRDTGFRSFIVSNEQYLENVLKTEEFFRGIARRAELQIVIFVRPPATWLPSAYMQWGVVHKTNLGPLLPFSVRARGLMRQYDHIRHWRDLYGSAVTVLPFDDNMDVVHDMSKYLGVNLASDLRKYQSRPSISEALMRGSFNNIHNSVALPELFNELYEMGIPNGSPRSLISKFSYIFDEKEFSNIISENMEILNYLEEEFDINLTNVNIPEPAEFKLEELTNDILGAMMDLVFSQAHKIKELSSRLEALESQNKSK